MEIERDRAWTMGELPQTMTEPCFRHFETDAQVGWTVASANQLANYVSHLFLSWAENYLHELPRSKANFDASAAWQAKSRTAHDVAIRSEQLNLQTMLTRVVGSFLSYVSEMLSLVFHQNPALLLDDDRAQYQNVQSLLSPEDRLRDIVEKRVAALSFDGLTGIQKHIEEQLNLKLFEDSANLEEVARVIAQRNLIIHGRAIADTKYLRRMGGYTTLKRGESLVLEQQSVEMQARIFRLAVADIDARASDQFALSKLITAEQFYERVQIPFFVGDWRNTFNVDDPLLADTADESPS